MTVLRKTELQFFVVILLFGVLGVATAYTGLSWTSDEPYHIFCGMQWWKEGKYSHQPLHPPLARVMDASFGYFYEIISGSPTIQGVDARQNYIYKLVLARLGTLPFYVLSCFIVFQWSRRLYGAMAALLSLGMYVTLSSVTAHAALATTDMAYTAVFLWAIYCGVDWLATPSRQKSIILGASLGIMVGTKFSGLVHWPAAMGLIVAVQYLNNYRLTRQHVLQGLWALPVMALTLAIIYRFQLMPLIDGIKAARNLDNISFGVWFYGPFKTGGAWNFFPVVFFFKTPLSFLVASGFGNYRSFVADGSLKRLTPLVAAIAVMLISMTSHINLGVRHVLPLYPLLAIPSGYGLSVLWNSAKQKRLFAVLLVACQISGFILASPQHLSYFNLLAGKHPETITLDSDFDWGQDMLALDKALQERGIETVFMCARKDTYANAAIVVRAKINPCPKEESKGWFAVGRAQMLLNNNIAWLKRHQALHIENSTMDLYHIP